MMIRAKIIAIMSLFISALACGQNVDLTTYLPNDYVKDGSVDYTTFLQKGLDENKNVLFPDFPILVNENGLKIRDNQTLNFAANSVLIMKPNANETYSLLNLTNIQNVVINNPNLVGDKEMHLGKEGEWGMGINIYSSKNIIINNPNISKFWGDGIYIGEIPHKERGNYKLGDYSSGKIVIRGGVINDNRRNGISVVSVKELLIENTLIQNTNGILPMAGICIEPNNNEQYLESITIKGVTTKNNAEVGIKYVSSSLLGKRNRNVSIGIIDCTDMGSKVGLFLGGARASQRGKIEKLLGQITVDNFKSHSNVTPISYGSIQNYNPAITLNSFLIYDKIGKRDHQGERNIKSKIRANGISVN